MRNKRSNAYRTRWDNVIGIEQPYNPRNKRCDWKDASTYAGLTNPHAGRRLNMLRAEKSLRNLGKVM